MKLAPYLLALSLTASAAAAAEPAGFEGRVDGLAHSWAHVNYEVRDSAARRRRFLIVSEQVRIVLGGMVGRLHLSTLRQRWRFVKANQAA